MLRLPTENTLDREENIMAEWITTTLEECTDILGDGLHGTPKYTENGEYAFVNGNNLVDGEILIKKETKRVDYSQYDKYKKPLTNRTILVSINGTLGNVGVYGSEKIILGKSACYFNVKESVDKDFIYYIVSSPTFKQYLESNATGTTIKNISLKQMREYTFELPEIGEQKRISSILRKIDEKIKNNRAINNNLLEQLNQLYTEFSTRSDWSEMSIGDVAVKVAMGPFGSNIKVSTFVEYGVPIISGNHLRGYFLEEPSYNYITEEHAEKLKNSIVYPKDIIFTHAGNIGQVAMIPDGCEFPYYVLSQRQFYLRCNTEQVVPEYVLLFFHSKKGQHELLSYANQTGVPSIAQPATNLKKIRLPIPSLDKQKDWLSVVTPLITMYQNNYQATKRLASLRDTLLPKLMSGGINVSNLDL